ncbi:MAG: DUF819 family protein [Pseudomonadota bacterium]
MITDPMTLAVTLIGITTGVYAVSTFPRLAPLFRFFPPVVWLYFVPMLLATAGLLPAEHSLYSALAKYALPMALVLLTVSTDLRAIASVGMPALIALAAGAFGVCMGSILSLFLFSSWLPDDVWRALTMLNASWIGGSANMVAMQQSLNVPAEYVGPIVVVDTVVAYSWLGILIALSTYQTSIDKVLRADLTALNKVATQLEAAREEFSVASVHSICIVLGAGLVAAFLSRLAGEALPELGDPKIITATTWAILISVSVGLLLSGSRLGRVARRHRASEYAYAALFLLLVSVGAQADLRAVTEAPLFLVVGVVVLATHLVILLAICRYLRLPSFFVAVGSMANIGGAVSGPVAAAAYRPALAPVGALLGVAGYILGIYLPLAVAFVLSSIAG